MPLLAKWKSLLPNSRYRCGLDERSDIRVISFKKGSRSPGEERSGQRRSMPADAPTDTGDHTVRLVTRRIRVVHEMPLAWLHFGAGIEKGSARDDNTRAR